MGNRRVRALSLNNLLSDVDGDGLDVSPVGKLRVGHHRRRIAVEEDDLNALLAQRLDGLRARIVELTGLADDDGPGTDDQDLVDVSTLGHRAGACTTKRRLPGITRAEGRLEETAPAPL